MLLAEDSKPLCVSFVFCLLLLKYSGQRVQHIHCCLLPAFSTLLLFVENDAVFCAWCMVGSCGNTVPAPDGSTICMTSHSCWCCRVALCVAPFVTVCTATPPPVPVTGIAGTCRNVLPERCDSVRLNVFE